MKPNFYLEAKKLWRTVSKSDFSEPNELQLQIEINKKLLNIFQAGDFYHFVFNVYQGDFEHISDDLYKVLGYKPSEMNVGFFLSCIHPQDQPYFLNFEKTVVEFYDSILPEEISKYKVQYDFRIKNANNNYVRILHQLVVLQHNGNILERSFGLHTDISHIKPDGIPLFSMIGLENQPSFYNIQPEIFFKKSVEVLSKREREILRFIVEGKKSDEISKQLCISIHTVNSHRKKILNKTNTKTPTELVFKSINEGWI